MDQQPLMCPRCDSTNTKFCYYNNYTKSQPRHYCRSCNKHWTEGGSLRNVTSRAVKKRKVSKTKTSSSKSKNKKVGPTCKLGCSNVDEVLGKKMDGTQLVDQQKDESFGGISAGYEQSHVLFDNLECSDVGLRDGNVGCSSFFDHEMFSFQQLPCVSDNDLNLKDFHHHESFCVTDLLTMDDDDDVPKITPPWV